MASVKKRAKSRAPALESETLAKFLERATELHGEGRLDEAAQLYLHVTERNPEALAASYFLALIDIEAGWLDRALERLRLVTRQDPSSFDALFALGHTFGELGQWPQAVNAYRRARTLKPQSTTARFALARALEVVGQLDEAITLFRELVDLAPVRLNALMSIAHLKPSEITPAEIEEMAAMSQDPKIFVAGQIGLLFALANVLEASRRYDDAFAAYLEGNRMRREGLVEGAEETPDVAIASPGSRPKLNTPQRATDLHMQGIKRAKEIFTPDFIASHSGKGHDSPAPIFILGMPRSGSTLLEQILSSHSKVEGLGEGPALWRTISGRFPLSFEAGAEGDPEFFRKLAENYLERQRAFGWHKAPFVVDKMLGNYMSIGMIHLMFPNAKILHSVRDPVDTCLACFRKLFRTGNETTYGLRDIGEQYVRYREMMAHWETVLPGRVVNVLHEELVADPDTRIRWLVEDACKLRWDENCLRFHQTKRAVRTASIAQVRQPIFSTSLQRWRKYASHLGPLMEALGPYAPADF